MVVEAELGQLAGIEDAVNVKAEDASFTHPDEVCEFTEKTGCDSLAIAIGTSHGAYKFKPGQKPQLRFDILEEVGKRLPGFPIVLHGASSVPQDRVAIINQFGGKMPDAIGIPEDMLRKAATMAVCKINIDSDLRVACTAAIRKHLFEHPDHFDPRQYLGDARAAVKRSSATRSSKCSAAKTRRKFFAAQPSAAEKPSGGDLTKEQARAHPERMRPLFFLPDLSADANETAARPSSDQLRAQ